MDWRAGWPGELPLLQRKQKRGEHLPAYEPQTKGEKIVSLLVQAAIYGIIAALVLSLLIWLIYIDSHSGTGIH